MKISLLARLVMVVVAIFTVSGCIIIPDGRERHQRVIDDRDDHRGEHGDHHDHHDDHENHEGHH